jgi:hypothetical protein
MDRTANSNAITMSTKIDIKFFVRTKYFDLENADKRKKNRVRGKVGRRASGRGGV